MESYTEINIYNINNYKYMLVIIILILLLIIYSTTKTSIYSSENITVSDNKIYVKKNNTYTVNHRKNLLLINNKKYKFRVVWLDKDTYNVLLNKKKYVSTNDNIKLYKGSVSLLKSFLNILRTKGET